MRISAHHLKMSNIPPYIEKRMLNHFEKEWLSKNGRNWTRVEVEERDDFVWWQVYGQIKDKEDEL